MRKKEYTLVGVDGNAFAIMGYVMRAMEVEDFSKEEIDDYHYDTTSADYNHLLMVSVKMIEECNKHANLKGTLME